LCKLKRYEGLDEKTLDMLVSEAINFAKGIIDPLQEIGEAKGLQFDKGKVICPSEFKKVFAQYGKDGWIAASIDTEYGGQGFPHMMRIIVNDFMYGACQPFNMAPMVFKLWI
jgi:alkylation response protein AidB-like acyl-CoA dehydrogenase